MLDSEERMNHFVAVQGKKLVLIRELTGGPVSGSAPMTPSASSAPMTPVPTSLPTPMDAAQAILLLTGLSTSDLEMQALQLTHEQPPGFERAVRALELIYFLP